jgi:hypothetical protein
MPSKCTGIQTHFPTIILNLWGSNPIFVGILIPIDPIFVGE